VALSGTVIEQMDDLDEIGADYFIPRARSINWHHLNEFITGLESRRRSREREKNPADRRRLSAPRCHELLVPSTSFNRDQISLGWGF